MYNVDFCCYLALQKSLSLKIIVCFLVKHISCRIFKLFLQRNIWEIIKSYYNQLLQHLAMHGPKFLQ